MSESNPHEGPRRKGLKVAVSALCADTGFVGAEDSCLETLTEMLQSFITEVGKSGHGYSELSGRTVPMLGDVILALVETGINVESLPSYARKTNKIMVLPPGVSAAVNPARSLQAGDKRSHPNHVPDYLPHFPDPHTYIKTMTHKEPVTQYQIVREKAASQKRDVERALTRFIAKTGDTENLFQDDPYAFPLISHRCGQLPYLEALCSKDEETTVEDEVDKESQIHANINKAELKAAELEQLNLSQESTTSRQSQDGAGSTTTSRQSQDGAGGKEGEENQIDNPYLRTIKMPKFKGGGGKKKW